MTLLLFKFFDTADRISKKKIITINRMLSWGLWNSIYIQIILISNTKRKLFSKKLINFINLFCIKYHKKKENYRTIVKSGVQYED